jgi:hypothetical protein
VKSSSEITTTVPAAATQVFSRNPSCVFVADGDSNDIARFLEGCSQPRGRQLFQSLSFRLNQEAPQFILRSKHGRIRQQ